MGIEFLPGFDGPLPFALETGYIGVDESDDVQLFYYFFPSENNPKEDPLLLWLTGGPGCSTISAIFYEIGPIKFQEVKYNGSLPRLELHPYSWTKWLIDHPEFQSNPVYLGGDSYSGITLPAYFHEMSKGNEMGMQPFINLKLAYILAKESKCFRDTYLLGNPGTNFTLENNFAIPYAHGMGLISDELYESLQRTCKGNYNLQTQDPANAECIYNILSYYKCVMGIQTTHILEPFCDFASPKPQSNGSPESFRRSLYQDDSKYILNNQISSSSSLNAFRCRSDGYLLSGYWLNNESVRKALNIRKGSTKTWIRCNYGLNYTNDISSSVIYHKILISKGYRSLIYSGDHDMVVPFLGTQAWIRSLNYSIVNKYTRTYANNMTFATVKGGGHTAPEYKPKECYSMFKRWVSGQPL
ncbi:hypothetical protein V2J09_023863 [Rumex salicifolius]